MMNYSWSTKKCSLKFLKPIWYFLDLEFLKHKHQSSWHAYFLLFLGFNFQRFFFKAIRRSFPCFAPNFNRGHQVGRGSWKNLSRVSFRVGRSAPKVCETNVPKPFGSLHRSHWRQIRPHYQRFLLYLGCALNVIVMMSI